MAWRTLTMEVGAEHADTLADALLALGALSVDILDADSGLPDEHPLFGEPGEPAPGCWAHNQVTALFAEDVAVDTILRQALLDAGMDKMPACRTSTLADSDWVRLTQSQFSPIRISRRLWIVPTWHAPEDPAAINISLDPGLAFGTGSHPTTRLCLRWLDSHIKPGQSVLDYGCGSGILAIAAGKLGAGRVIGIDIDAQAVSASQANAAANRVSAEFYLPDLAPPVQADIVLANILTNPLKMLAPLLAGATRTGGCLVLSGILEEQAGEVMEIYSQAFDLEPPVMEDGWACLTGVKR